MRTNSLSATGGSASGGQPVTLTLATAFCACFLAGCVSAPPDLRPKSPMALIPLPDVTVQYRMSAATGGGHNTCEIYLKNINAVPVTFGPVSLNGSNLPPESAEVAWWEFYPQAKVDPGATVLCQINFRQTAQKPQMVRIADSAGGSVDVTAPPYQTPDKQIAGVTYSLDGKRMFIQLQAGRWLPVRLWINRQEVMNFRVLKVPGGNGPNMVVCEPPNPIVTGMPLHLALRFNDGTWRHGYVRALRGIFLDAYGLSDVKVRKELCLDLDPQLYPLKAADSADVACFDARHHNEGGGARLLISEMQELRANVAYSNKLTAVQFCTALYNSVWDIYGPLADGVLVSPYALSHGHDPAHLIDYEENLLKQAAASAKPRPWFWIPDVQKRKARFLEPAELEVETWMTLAMGCKGIKYFAYTFQDRGFAGYPPLVEAIGKQNREIRKRETLLAPLAPVSEHVIQGQPGENGIKVYMAWSGDRGMVVLVRNLDYQTDAQDDNEGRSPRFKVQAKKNITVPVVLPQWMGFKRVVNLQTGKKVAAQAGAHGRLAITLENLGACEVLWIANCQSRNWFRLH